MSPRGATRRRPASRLYPAIGIVAIAVLAVIVLISYRANSGLPFQPSYEVTVDVPNADRMIKNNEVRVGGIRVGQVADVKAMPPDGAHREPFTRMELSLSKDVQPLPADTRVKVRPASILGATYVDLTLGRSRDDVPDGGRLELAQAQSTVELTDLLDIFDRSTARSLQRTITSLGDGVAGRGGAFNALLGELSALLPPATTVARTLAAPRTRFGGFLRGYEAFAGALAPVSPQLGRLMQDGSTTFGALAARREQLAQTIEALPVAASTTTAMLTRLRPSLDGLAALATDLRPAGQRLPATLGRINTTLRAGYEPLERLPAFSRDLRGTLAGLRTLTRRPSTSGTLRKARDTLAAGGTTLELLTPAELHCKVISLWGNRFASSFGSMGAGQGPAIVNIGVTHLGAQGELLQSAKPASNVGINYLPKADANECEAGYEPYAGKQLINSPPGYQRATPPPTPAPPRVHELARRAGLMELPKDAR